MITLPASQRKLVHPLVTNVNECYIGRESLFVWENKEDMNKLCDQNAFLCEARCLKLKGLGLLEKMVKFSVDFKQVLSQISFEIKKDNLKVVS